MAERWTADECLSLGGFVTIRPYDGTPNGDTEAHPIATVYQHQHGAVIAAAPDLLAAARAALVYVGDVETDDSPEAVETRRVLRVAIAKAEGRAND